MRTTGRTAALLLSIALAAAPFGVVRAHEYDGQTAGAWDYDSAGDRFYGRVGSVVDACVRRRLVKVQEADGPNWDTVGKARTNRRGKWHLDMTDAKGTFRIVVRPRMKVTIEHDHRCTRFASPSAEVGR